MSFYDYISYKSLCNRVANNNHYRGSPNRFPLASRRELRYYLLVEEENGEKVFDLCYDKTGERVPITKEEYDELQAKGEYTFKSHTNEYYKYVSRPNTLLRVRPDETFEFIANHYGQGNRCFLNRFSVGLFNNDSRRGGVVYHTSGQMFPIYHGMRVNKDMKPLGDVKVTTLSVNRTKSKALVKQYENFFKTTEVMASAITDMDVWASTVKDVWDDHFPDRTDYDDIDVMEEAMKIINGAPLDAFVLNAIYHRYGSMCSMARSGKHSGWTRVDNSPSAIFEKTKRNMTKMLYKNSPDVFVEKTFDIGEKFAASAWPITITVNGTPVKQYGYSAD